MARTETLEWFCKRREKDVRRQGKKQRNKEMMNRWREYGKIRPIFPCYTQKLWRKGAPVASGPKWIVYWQTEQRKHVEVVECRARTDQLHVLHSAHPDHRALEPEVCSYSPTSTTNAARCTAVPKTVG